jgi:hypothetical protein
MNNVTQLAQKCLSVLSLVILIFTSVQSIAQASKGWELEKIPADLETDFALSALPPHLRHDATVYLLDPKKGYYIAHKGSNGFICFVSRTEWEWVEFRKDLATPISYDAEGARAIFPIYIEVAGMRASGKFTPLKIKNSIMNKIQKGIYKAPARAGVSYMLAPVMRVYPTTPDNKEIVTMSMPHYMFYAPYITNADIGSTLHDGPTVNNPGAMILGERKGPYGYIILPVGETEKAKIIAENKDLLKRLTAYKPYFNIESAANHHAN